jgi:uncharacterized protein YciI
MKFMRRALAAVVMALLAGLPAAAGEPAQSVAMKQFVLGLLYKGENWKPAVTDEARRLQSAHRANIDRLVREGAMAVAGPVDSTDELRGVFIFNVDTVEKAQALVASDPAVQAGQLRFKLYVWYGPVAIADATNASRQAPDTK